MKERITDLAVVTGGDDRFFDLLRGMLRSLQDRAESYEITVYVFDLGLTDTQRKWLLTQGAKLHAPRDSACREESPHFLHAFLSRSRLPDLFLGHDVYLWIDADTWIQRWDAVEAYVEGASLTGFAVTPEADPAYDDRNVRKWREANYEIFGPEQIRFSGRTVR